MKISVWKKIIVCGLAALMAPFCIHSDISHYLSLGIPDAVITIPALTISLCAVLCIPIWHYFENKRGINSEKVLAFWQGFIIYLEAFVFFRFGLLKLFGLHMSSSLIFDDMPAGALSGYHLMDYFFGRAPVFKILIGSMQLVGATAILFRKTRWFGIFILLPVVANIVFMNIFYEIGGGITITAITLTIGLIYLLLQDKEKLKTIFFKSESSMPAFAFKNGSLKNILKVSSLAVSLIILIPSVKPISNMSILGKYNVSALSINDEIVPIDRNKDSVLTTVYFDENETCVLRYNDYKKLKIGKVTYNDHTQKLEIKWRYPKNQGGISSWKLSTPDAKNSRTLSGSMNNKGFTATLVKVDLPAPVIK